MAPPPVARTAKRLGVHVRYRVQARRCRQGFREFGHHYQQPILFIAGLPKSGTTWLKQMVSGYPGYSEILIPDVAAYELATGGSDDYDLPADTFERTRRMLAVMKMHVHGSTANTQLLKTHSIPYVVLYRDLRDVAVSHYFYVRQTPWHPEYPLYAPLDIDGALRLFADRTLERFAAWVRGWHARHDASLGLLIRYEDLLADTPATLGRVAQHFALDNAGVSPEAIADAHSFARKSGGRDRGQESHTSFLRKGVAGDWKKQFTPAMRALYKERIGDFLIEFGYERDDRW